MSEGEGMMMKVRAVTLGTVLLGGAMFFAGAMAARTSSWLAFAGLAVLVLAAGLGVLVWLSRQNTRTFRKLIAATKAVEEGEYKSGMLEGVSRRKDELGDLGYTFDSMAREVSLRNQRLKLLLRVIPAGVALSMENDFNRLLEAIVVESQSITNADGGTLYMLRDDKLHFVILRNTSLNIAMGGTTGNAIAYDPLPMYDKETGEPNHRNVATHAALGHEWVNIPDAYQAEGFDFSGTRAFDKKTGYHSTSFLTVPLEGDDHHVIGVLQLINATDPETGRVIPFGTDEVLGALVLLASTALAGYIRQERLRKEIEKLNIQIDQAKKSRQVSEITESDYFRTLLEKVRELRALRKDPAD
jgi:HAMP domain-containing protein